MVVEVVGCKRRLKLSQKPSSVDHHHVDVVVVVEDKQMMGFDESRVEEEREQSLWYTHGTYTKQTTKG